MNSDNSLVLDFNEICRLCLSKEGNMLPIFDNDTKEDELSLASRIAMCASIQVSQGDGLPMLVCNRCVNQLDGWYTFKEQCCSSDATLRQYLTSHAKILTKPIKLEPNSPTECSSDYPFICTVASKKTKQSVGTMTVSRKTKKIYVTPRNSLNYVSVSDYMENSVDLGMISCKLEDSEEHQTVDDDPLECVQVSVVSCNNKLENVKDEDSDSLDFEFPPLPKKRQFSCSQCSRSFTYFTSLQNHEALHSEVKEFACTECSKVFDKSSKLKLHMETHLPDKPHICTTCGKAFKTKSNLRLHLLTHSETPSYLCNVCGMLSKTKSSLNRHLLGHSAQKNHVCQECGKRFTFKNSLGIHMKVHRPERPLSCEQCGKGFKRREGLRRHLRTHAGEQPFSCFFCARKFSGKWNLTQHIRLHTGNKPYVCTVCGQAFTHNVTLRSHAKQHAGNSDNSDNK